MSTALMEKANGAISLPPEQVELIKRTVAQGATNDELALFLYDCQRRGIHPLDKLLHFTKRGGRYTPVTSIDFMRAQAAATGEMAGSDEPVFTENTVRESPYPEAATVTVYRLTQGQRFAYTATARWAEYCPDNAPMWKRMPHTMLGKCAEALALRKAFPQQLAGLYSREEMDQADKGGYVVEAPAAVPTRAAVVPPTESGGDSQGRPVRAETPVDADLSAGSNTLTIQRIESAPTKNANVTKYSIVLSTGEVVTTIKSQLASLCEQLCQEQAAITVETKATKWGIDLVAVHRVRDVIPEVTNEECAACGLPRYRCLCQTDAPF